MSQPVWNEEFGGEVQFLRNLNEEFELEKLNLVLNYEQYKSDNLFLELISAVVQSTWWLIDEFDHIAVWIGLEPGTKLPMHSTCNSYAELAKLLKEKYFDSLQWGKGRHRLRELKRVTSFYSYNYAEKCLELYDLYVFRGGRTIKVSLDENDKTFLLESEEAKIIEQKILENMCKKNLFKTRFGLDDGLALRAKMLYSKI